LNASVFFNFGFAYTTLALNSLINLLYGLAGLDGGFGNKYPFFTTYLSATEIVLK